MYEKFLTQRSRPSRLNGVAPKNRIGTSFVRKKCRTSEMFLSRRRGVPELAAVAASVATLISRGADLAGADLTAAFLAGAFLTGALLAGAVFARVAVARL